MKNKMMLVGVVAVVFAASLQAATVTGVVDTRTDANARVVASTVTLGTPSGGTATSWNSAERSFSARQLARK